MQRERLYSGDPVGVSAPGGVDECPQGRGRGGGQVCVLMSFEGTFLLCVTSCDGANTRVVPVSASSLSLCHHTLVKASVTCCYHVVIMLAWLDAKSLMSVKQLLEGGHVSPRLLGWELKV